MGIVHNAGVVTGMHILSLLVQLIIFFFALILTFLHSLPPNLLLKGKLTKFYL